MSRVAKAPITIESGIDVSLSGATLTAKGKLGQLTMDVNPAVVVAINDNEITFTIAKVEKKAEKLAWAQAGTARANTANLIQGVSAGWEKKLSLIGVGYRAKAMGNHLI